MDPKLARGLVREMFRRNSAGAFPVLETTYMEVYRALGFMKGNGISKGMVRGMSAGNALAMLRTFDDIQRTGGSVYGWSRPVNRVRSLKTDFSYAAVHFLPHPFFANYAGVRAEFLSFVAVSCMASPYSFRIRNVALPIYISKHAIERFLVRSAQDLPEFWKDLVPSLLLSVYFGHSRDRIDIPFVLPNPYGLYLGTATVVRDEMDACSQYVDVSPGGVRVNEEDILMSQENDGFRRGFFVSTFVDADILRPDQEFIRERLTDFMKSRGGLLIDCVLREFSFPQLAEQDVVWGRDDFSKHHQSLLSDLKAITGMREWGCSVRDVPTMMGQSYEGFREVENRALSERAIAKAVRPVSAL